MLRGYVKTVSIAAAIMSVAGLAILVSSVKFGTSAAQAWLAARGGADTAFYHVIVESYIRNFQIVGGIFMGVGLLVAFLGFLKLRMLHEQL